MRAHNGNSGQGTSVVVVLFTRAPHSAERKTPPPRASCAALFCDCENGKNKKFSPNRSGEGGRGAGGGGDCGGRLRKGAGRVLRRGFEVKISGTDCHRRRRGDFGFVVEKSAKEGQTKNSNKF